MIVAAAGMCCASAGVLGQGVEIGSPPDEAGQAAPPNRAQVDPLDITGRDFAGVRLSRAAVPGDTSMSATKARVWRETDADGSTVQRLLLEGDVVVQMGLHRFVAARAVVWIQQLGEPSATDGVTRQIAVYFDRVSDPGAEAGVGHTADRLLVTGGTTTTPTLPPRSE